MHERWVYKVVSANQEKEMETFKKLDNTLKFINSVTDGKGIDAMDVFNESGKKMEISDPEQWKLLMKLQKDGFIKRHINQQPQKEGPPIEKPTKRFSSTIDGKIFLENGGYEMQFKITKREKLHSWVSQWFNILWKPFAIVLGLLTIIRLTILIFEHLNK